MPIAMKDNAGVVQVKNHGKFRGGATPLTCPQKLSNPNVGLMSTILRHRGAHLPFAVSGYERSGGRMFFA